jgi:hypothetical protein
VVFNNILWVFYMSLLIVDVLKELKRCTAELKESNDKWEAKEQMALEQYNLEQGYEPTTTLRPDNDGAASTGSIKHTQTSNRGAKDEL